jgi:hypothetical protein
MKLKNEKMKFIQLLLALSVLSIISQSCYKRGGPWGMKGKGENVKETRDISGFTRIDLSIDADISYTQDSIYKFEISAQPNILKILTTEVKGSTLRMEFQRNVWDHNKIKITIHSPAIEAFSISGSGDIQALNTIVSDDLDLNISGSGNISIPSLQSKKLTAKISGSGNMQISGGKADREDFSISGSGDIDVEKVIASDNSSKISGSGDMILNVTEHLDISISGSGDIRYRGRPTVDSQISGSGKLIHID